MNKDTSISWRPTRRCSPGETNYGAPDCGVPLRTLHIQTDPLPGDARILGCRPVIRRRRYFTTVGHWDQSVKDLEYNGERYSWSKHREFLKILESATPHELRNFPWPWPSMILRPCRCSKATGGMWKMPMKPRRPWRAIGQYIWGSRGELTVAKDMNVRLRSGWFSERSACYLAAGKPVITQETGFSKSFPRGWDCMRFARSRISLLPLRRSTVTTRNIPKLPRKLPRNTSMLKRCCDR